MPDKRAVDRERIGRQPLVGVDEAGAEHRFDQYHDTVFVLTAEGDLEHVERLQPGQLPEWVSYVDEKRGWRDCRYTGTGTGDPFATLAIRLARTLEPAP